MKLKMQSVLGFATFYEAVGNGKLPIKTAYKLNKLTKAIDSEITFYREKLQAIINEFAELDEKGNPIPTEDGNGVKLRPESEADCYAAVCELQDIEVELPDITFTFDEFDNTQLTMTEFAAAEPFFTE